MYHITTHACERFLERELGYITWTIDDIIRARKYLITRIWHVIVDKFILVFTKAKKVLITLYPSDEETIDYLKGNITYDIDILEESNIPKMFKPLGVKGKYPDPSLLSVSITEHKKKIHITVNDLKKPYNPSGCFCSVEKTEKFIIDYTEFYSCYLVKLN